LPSVVVVARLFPRTRRDTEILRRYICDTSHEGGATASNARARILRGRHGQDRGDREGEARARGARGYRDRRAPRRASPPIPSPPPARPDPSSLSHPHLNPRSERRTPTPARSASHRCARSSSPSTGTRSRSTWWTGRSPTSAGPATRSTSSTSYPSKRRLPRGNTRQPTFHLLNRENHDQNQTFLAQALRARHLRRIRRLHPGPTRPRTGT
jgi:hypothetical protein